MALNTYKTFLMKGTEGSGESAGTITYAKLVDIKSYPDLGGAPETIDVTTLSDPITQSINGIQSLDSLEFDANYTLADYQTLKALEGEQLFLAVWFGGTESSGIVTPTGSDGKFEFTGELSVRVNGGGVNEARGMTISIAVSSPIELITT